jgi:putative acyl-CoA dehydrogenase
MLNVLADLTIESEAATVAALRVARSYDDGDDRPFRRVATAAMKYWVCKRGPAHAAEALECLGGNGFVEDSGLPLLYRDAPLNSIWEGSGNVAALDVLRVLAKEPGAAAAFLAECRLGAGGDRRLDRHLDRLSATLGVMVGDGGAADDGGAVERRMFDGQFSARRLVEDMALGLQGSLLVRFSTPAVADAFCAARLDGQSGQVYGTLPPGVDAAAIADRALPA